MHRLWPRASSLIVEETLVSFTRGDRGDAATIAFEFSNLSHWNLFAFWDLLFEIYSISNPIAPLLQLKRLQIIIV